ncbi:hypothetical protein ACQ4PT_048853 [Festuca glaucescens]
MAGSPAPLRCREGLAADLDEVVGPRRAQGESLVRPESDGEDDTDGGEVWLEPASARLDEGGGWRSSVGGGPPSPAHPGTGGGRRSSSSVRRSQGRSRGGVAGVGAGQWGMGGSRRWPRCSRPPPPQSPPLRLPRHGATGRVSVGAGREEQGGGAGGIGGGASEEVCGGDSAGRELRGRGGGRMMKMGSVLSAPLKNIWKNQFKGQQEDAHEFLSCLLDNLHKCTLDPKSKGKPSSFDEESIVKQVFGGRLKLSLDIDQVDDLVAALESFTKVEQLGDAENKLTCESCNGQVCMDKKLVLDEEPDVVAFQLKRFTTLDGTIEKIDKHVAYPSKLDLQPFHSNPDKEVKFLTVKFVLQVDSITETSALHQEAYLLFYVRQGMFPWFSSLLQEATSGAPSATEITKPERPSTPPPRPKRTYSVNDHNVFAFENLVAVTNHYLSAVTEHQTNMKKPKVASASKSLKSSSLDQNASRLLRGMTFARRK